MEKEIFKVFNKASSIIGSIFSALTTLFGIEWFLFLGYLILNILDYITGTIKSKIKKTESSSRGLFGIIKKISYWILILISFLISFLLVELGIKINLNLEFIMLFGWFTLACLIVNESRSIIENLIEIGIDVPNFLISGLNIYNNILEKKTDTFIDNINPKEKKD